MDTSPTYSIKFYEKVERATGDDILDVYTKIEDAPTHEELEDTDELQYCYVFDDTLYEDLSMVEQLYTKNRHHNTMAIMTLIE